MPYVITTRLDAEFGSEYETRRSRAVATWLEAEHDTELLIEDHGGSIDEWPDVPEAGGTVGPLPDGTLIEVTQASWADLAGKPSITAAVAVNYAGDWPEAHVATAREAILADFNARS